MPKNIRLTSTHTARLTGSLTAGLRQLCYRSTIATIGPDATLFCAGTGPMPISVSCQCGQSFQAPGHMAGQVVPCPSCQEPLPISASQPRSSMDSLLDDVGIDLKGDSTGKCPSCYADLKPNAVICISCGINLESRVSVVKKKKKEFIQHFFSTIQLVFAGNDTEGLRHGVIGTPERFFLQWKDFSPNRTGFTHALHRFCRGSTHLPSCFRSL